MGGLDSNSQRAPKSGDVGRAIEKIKKFKKVIGVGKLGYETTQSVTKREYWEALSSGLEGGVTILEAAVDARVKAIPALLSNPYVRGVKALGRAVSLVNYAEHSLTAAEAASRKKQLEEVAQKFDEALAVLRQKEAASQNLTSAESSSKSKNDGKPKPPPPKIDDPPPPKDPINELSDKIEGLKGYDPGPIFLDYESGGVRTDTPPPEMKGEQLRRWLEAHGDFLKYAKDKIASQSDASTKPPEELLQPGKEQELSKWLAKHPELLKRVLENNLPPEAKDKPILISDQQATSLSQIPRGWIECQCPHSHPNLGIFVKDGDVVRQFHSPDFKCP